VPRGESAIGLCSRRSGVAWRWPCFNWVWPTRKLCDGLPGSRDVRRLGDHDTVTTLDWCVSRSPRTCRQRCVARWSRCPCPRRYPSRARRRQPRQRGMARPSLVCYCVSRSKGHAAANSVRRFDGEISFWCKGLYFRPEQSRNVSQQQQKLVHSWNRFYSASWARPLVVSPQSLGGENVSAAEVSMLPRPGGSLATTLRTVGARGLC
jgi:hypothetical protein